jgi:hypothetical protein
MQFKKWLFFTESREEKTLTQEFADKDIVQKLSTAIPQGQKYTDAITLLGAYYHLQQPNIKTLQKDISDYVELYKNSKMPLIKVDLTTKEPPEKYKKYLYWSQIIHGHNQEKSSKQAKKFRPSDIDFQNEKPIMTSPDGKIRVYDAHSPEKCIILGRGQTFCISQPGNTMWQSYRDDQTSTFYFVYDDSRDDELSIVVVDKNDSGTTLTDRNNKTGTTKDPFTDQETSESEPYLKYLQSKGIDVNKLVNKEKTDQEEKEDYLLSKPLDELNWFIYLSPEYKSKYIGRGHPLTNQQFDYLWENKFINLLEQYSRTGRKLPNEQIDKILSNPDLKKNYIHNRIIAQNHQMNLSSKEWHNTTDEQKKYLEEHLSDESKLQLMATVGNLEKVKELMSKEVPANYLVQDAAIQSGNMDTLIYIMSQPNFSISQNALTTAISTDQKFDLIKLLIDKNAPLNHRETALITAGSKNRLDVIDYILKNRNIQPESLNYCLKSAAKNGHIELVKYLISKNTPLHGTVGAAGNYPEIVKYLVEVAKAPFEHDTLVSVAKYGNKELVDYLLQKGAKINPRILHWAKKMEDYLADKIAKDPSLIDKGPFH